MISRLGPPDSLCPTEEAESNIAILLSLVVGLATIYLFVCTSVLVKYSGECSSEVYYASVLVKYIVRVF
jgi:hypothetical protein